MSPRLSSAHPHSTTTTSGPSMMLICISSVTLPALPSSSSPALHLSRHTSTLPGCLRQLAHSNIISIALINRQILLPLARCALHTRACLDRSIPLAPALSSVLKTCIEQTRSLMKPRHGFRIYTAIFWQTRYRFRRRLTSDSMLPHPRRLGLQQEYGDRP